MPRPRERFVVERESVHRRWEFLGAHPTLRQAQAQLEHLRGRYGHVRVTLDEQLPPLIELYPGDKLGGKPW